MPRRHAGADGERRTRRAAHGRDRGALLARHPRRRAGTTAGTHRGAGAPPPARDVSRRHAPLRRRDRQRRPRARPHPHPLRAHPHDGRPVHLRRERDRRPGARSGELSDEQGRARHGVRALLPGRRPLAGLQRRRCPRIRRDHPARRLAAAAALPRTPGHAGHDDDAGAGHAERPDERRRHAGTGGARGLRDPDAEGGRGRQAVPDVGRTRRRLWRPAGRRRHRCGLLRGAGELPGRVPRTRLPRDPPRLRHQPRQRRPRRVSRRLRHRARVRGVGRGLRARHPHRQRGEPALGHGGRPRGGRRPCGGQSRPRRRARAGALVRRQPPPPRRHPADRDRRRRRPRPPVRPRPRTGAARRAGGLRVGRGRLAVLRRGGEGGANSTSPPPGRPASRARTRARSTARNTSMPWSDLPPGEGRSPL